MISVVSIFCVYAAINILWTLIVGTAGIFSLATLAVVGRKALAVTTNCSLDFMRKPEAGRDIIARGTLLKLGRSLAVGDVHMFSEGADHMVARSTMTYSIPPKD